MKSKEQTQLTCIVILKTLEPPTWHEIGWHKHCPSIAGFYISFVFVFFQGVVKILFNLFVLVFSVSHFCSLFWDKFDDLTRFCQGVGVLMAEYQIYENIEKDINQFQVHERLSYRVPMFTKFTKHNIEWITLLHIPTTTNSFFYLTFDETTVCFPFALEK